MLNFMEGPPVKLTATFTDDTGALIDYTTVQFSFKVNITGTWPLTSVYGGATSAGTIEKTSTGLYYISVSTPTYAGLWEYGWQGLDGSSVVQAQSYGQLQVDPQPGGLF